MRVRHNKDAENLLLQYHNLYIDDCEQKHGKWKWFYNNNHLLKLEIGCGKGQFIINQALKYPQYDFIAIEKDATILLKAVRQAQSIIDQGYVINNLKFTLGDAKNIEFIFDDNEVDEIFLNFSDPWPKKHHTKRRLTSPFFLRQYYLILKPQGKIILKTDNALFFAYSMQTIKADPHWTVEYETNDLYQEIDLDINKENIKTEYEEKFIAQNVAIHKAVIKTNKSY